MKHTLWMLFTWLDWSQADTSMCNLYIFPQDQTSPLKSITSKLTSFFSKSDAFKVGSTISILLRDNMLSRSEVIYAQMLQSQKCNECRRKRDAARDWITDSAEYLLLCEDLGFDFNSYIVISIVWCVCVSSYIYSVWLPYLYWAASSPMRPRK